MTTINLEANLKTTADLTFLSLCGLVDDLKVEILHYRDKYETERKKNQLLKDAFNTIMSDQQHGQQTLYK